MTEDQIKHMVDRFLQWKLPEGFNPDGGILFRHGYQPVGTNLFTADQARAMILYMLDGVEALLPVASNAEDKEIIKDFIRRSDAYQLGRIAGLRQAAEHCHPEIRDRASRSQLASEFNRMADKIETGEEK